MSIEIKYKLGDLAKDLGAASKDIIEMLSALEKGEAKKHTTPLAENELNLVLEQMTNNAQEENFNAYFAMAAAAKKKEEKKQRPKEKLTVSANAGPLKKADGTIVEMPVKHKEKPAEKPAHAEAPKKEMVTVTVDTRSVDVNLDKFNEKYTSLAATKNVENRRKPMPAGNKQKFSGGKNRFGGRGPQGKKRETEAERLQRIQLEKARKAQLKVSIPDEITVGELATRLKVNVAQVIKKLMGLGVMASISEVIDFDTASLVAEELGAKVEDLEGIVSIPRRIEGVDVAVAFRENPSGTYKISVRTGEKANASAICENFGGGGHVKAAGCSIAASMAEAKALVLAEVKHIL